MSMGFKDILAADVSNVFTNSDEFGEVLSYRPKNGTARDVFCVVDDEGDYPDNSYGQDRTEFLDVFVARDAEGIDDPQQGDAIERNSRWFSFSGQVMKGDTAGWTLRFTRTVPSKHGGQPSR